jgi:hypothetical protein
VVVEQSVPQENPELDVKLRAVRIVEDAAFEGKSLPSWM